WFRHMPRNRDKPTSFKEYLQQAIPGATSPKMKDALAKTVSPEMKRAFKEMAERFQGEQPFQEEQDPPAAAPGPSTPEPSTPEPSTPEPSSSEASTPEPSPPEASTPASTSTSPTSPTSPASPASSTSAPEHRHGPQIDRADRALCELFPPDGKIPANMTYETARGMVATHLAPESRTKGLADPSWKVVKVAVGRRGRRGD